MFLYQGMPCKKYITYKGTIIKANFDVSKPIARLLLRTSHVISPLEHVSELGDSLAESIKGRAAGFPILRLIGDLLFFLTDPGLVLKPLNQQLALCNLTESPPPIILVELFLLEASKTNRRGINVERIFVAVVLRIRIGKVAELTVASLALAILDNTFLQLGFGLGRRLCHFGLLDLILRLLDLFLLPPTVELGVFFAFFVNALSSGGTLAPNGNEPSPLGESLTLVACGRTLTR